MTSPGGYYDAIIVVENHLRFVIGRHIAYERLVNVYKFRLRVY